MKSIFLCSVITLDSILDVSIGYPENIPQNERDILEGRFPQQVHFHVQAHNASELPPDRGGGGEVVPGMLGEKGKAAT